jgi:hypothetical protein
MGQWLRESEGCKWDGVALCTDQRPAATARTTSMGRGVPCQLCGALARNRKPGKKCIQRTEKDAFLEI